MIQPDVDLAYVQLYVSDVATYVDEMEERFGFQKFAVSEEARGCRSIAVRQNGVVLVITEPTSEQHQAAAYVVAHGDGVADITMHSADVVAAFTRAVLAGAKPIAEPTVCAGRLQATICAFGDLRHTLVQVGRPVDLDPLPSFARLTSRAAPARSPLRGVDHIAICLEPAMLGPAVTFYGSAFGFNSVLEEDLSSGDRGMRSKVIRSLSGSTTLNLLGPGPSAQPGQIDDFLEHHGGPGVQHIAFGTSDIVGTAEALSGRGVEFLQPSASYYEQLTRRFQPDRYSVAALRRFGVLADQDDNGELLQAFIRSTHVRRTLFFELVERCGASICGSNNIRALNEAVHLDQTHAATSTAHT